ncbi:MAG: DNA repair protein RadA [Bacteroidales bacterium]|jgi:DNA repair protein RadA/Sms|nr:DNA repair protein RadA [Bacteroidales bacterium]
MAKTRTVFLCSECGYESPKWVGQCPSCHAWNSFKEFQHNTSKKSSVRQIASETPAKAISIQEINATETKRLIFPFSEVNRVFGAGLVPGTVALIAGEPGIGKSTLLLQLLLQTQNIKSLYCSGEESLQQVKLRADRIGSNQSTCLFTDETDVDKLIHLAKETEAQVVVVDSIQTAFCDELDSVAGSITQIRDSAARIIRYAKSNQVAFLLVGHITKSGNIAGPMILEHMVDVVLQFEGDQNNFYRILRARKNRFGSTQEIGVFEMKQEGLREVANPSDIFLSGESAHLSGVALGASVEGIRPMLIEMQALVSSAVYGTPQRTSTGYDIRRLNMLLAVLEKRVGFRLNQKDVFVNIAGGLKITDTGLDLALLAAILSSDQDMNIPETTVLCGEVGLSGEVRSISRITQRISEADRLGFKRIIIPANSSKEKIQTRNIEIIPVLTVSEMLKALFRKK